jgi:hypothetical protein
VFAAVQNGFPKSPSDSFIVGALCSRISSTIKNRFFYVFLFNLFICYFRALFFDLNSLAGSGQRPVVSGQLN